MQAVQSHEELWRCYCTRVQHCEKTYMRCRQSVIHTLPSHDCCILQRPVLWRQNVLHTMPGPNSTWFGLPSPQTNFSLALSLAQHINHRHFVDSSTALSIGNDSLAHKAWGLSMLLSRLLLSISSSKWPALSKCDSRICYVSMAARDDHWARTSSEAVCPLDILLLAHPDSWGNSRHI